MGRDEVTPPGGAARWQLTSTSGLRKAEFFARALEPHHRLQALAPLPAQCLGIERLAALGEVALVVLSAEVVPVPGADPEPQRPAPSLGHAIYRGTEPSAGGTASAWQSTASLEVVVELIVIDPVHEAIVVVVGGHVPGLEVIVEGVVIDTVHEPVAVIVGAGDENV